MHRARALVGTAFRTTALMMLVVIPVLLLGGLFVLFSTRTALVSQQRDWIIQDAELLRDAYSTGGEQGLETFIRGATDTRSDATYIFGMFTADGTHVSGNLPVAPNFRGWGQLLSTDAAPLKRAEYNGYAEIVGQHLIVVGRSSDIVDGTTNQILLSLVLSGLGILFCSLTLGYFLSYRSASKLYSTYRTLDKVSRGETSLRLPVSHKDDQLDFVARQVNIHLDRLSELMETTRNTAVAIAHDLKTPLNKVSMALQDAASSTDPDQRTELIAVAEDELANLKGVLDTILRISRIEASDDSSSFVDFDAGALVADLVQTFEPVAEAAGQSLAIVLPDQAPAIIHGDRRMVQQLLVNLIENATRYAGEGAAITVRVSVEAGATALVVADTGPGIVPELRHRVLEPFFRVGPERSTPGTGLGLALVKAIVERHRATITLDDNAPGLKVTVGFPAARSDRA